MADPTTIMLFSSVLGAAGSFAEGEEARAAGEFNALQLEKEAKARYATGTRKAAEATRQGDILESNVRAAMAASGGVTTDAGATEMIATVGAESDYAALSALYEGTTQAEGLQMQATESRRAGRKKQRAAKMRGLGTIISGGLSAYESYDKKAAS